MRGWINLDRNWTELTSNEKKKYGVNFQKYTKDTKTYVRRKPQKRNIWKGISKALFKAWIIQIGIMLFLSHNLFSGKQIRPVHSTLGNPRGIRLSPILTDEEKKEMVKMVEIKRENIVYAEEEQKEDFNEEEMKFLISNTFGEYGDEMLICMQTENGTFDPKRQFNWNRNGTWDAGLMRVNSVHCEGRLKHLNFSSLEECREWLEDPVNNVNTAKSIFDDRVNGFSAWYGKSCVQFHNIRTK